MPPRFCKSAFITYDAETRPVGTKFANTIIHSRKRLRYREAQAILDRAEVIPHPDGGMLTSHDDDFKASIESDTGIRPPWAAEAFPDLDADVRQSIARVKASPFVPNKDSVRGFVYEVETGALREVS